MDATRSADRRRCPKEDLRWCSPGVPAGGANSKTNVGGFLTGSGVVRNATIAPKDTAPARTATPATAPVSGQSMSFVPMPLTLYDLYRTINIDLRQSREWSFRLITSVRLGCAWSAWRKACKRSVRLRPPDPDNQAANASPADVPRMRYPLRLRDRCRGCAISGRRTSVF